MCAPLSSCRGRHRRLGRWRRAARSRRRPARRAGEGSRSPASRTDGQRRPIRSLRAPPPGRAFLPRRAVAQDHRGTRCAHRPRIRPPARRPRSVLPPASCRRRDAAAAAGSRSGISDAPPRPGCGSNRVRRSRSTGRHRGTRVIVTGRTLASPARTRLTVETETRAASARSRIVGRGMVKSHFVS